MKIVSFGRYAGVMRELAHAVKEGDKEGIRYAARYYAATLPENAAIVPMPSHTGRATTILALAAAIRDERPDVRVCDCLACEPHMSSYAQKKFGWTPEPPRMRLLKRPPRRRTFIIDNCACSFATAGAATALMPFATLMVLAVSHWR